MLVEEITKNLHIGNASWSTDQCATADSYVFVRFGWVTEQEHWLFHNGKRLGALYLVTDFGFWIPKDKEFKGQFLEFYTEEVTEDIYESYQLGDPYLMANLQKHLYNILMTKEHWVQ